jgi:hypothetical protein
MAIIPEFANSAEAAAAGYLIKLPATYEHRGWLIITDYSRHKIRVFARERQGKIVIEPVTNMIPARRWGGRASGGKRVAFRWVRLPASDQPAETLICIADAKSKSGVATPLQWYATRAEWFRATAALHRLVDIRIDGRENIDLVET